MYIYGMKAIIKITDIPAKGLKVITDGINMRCEKVKVKAVLLVKDGQIICCADGVDILVDEKDLV